MKVGKETMKTWGWFISAIALLTAISPLAKITILNGVVLGGVLLLLGATIYSETRNARKQTKTIMQMLSVVLLLAGIATVMAVKIPAHLISLVSGLEVIGGLAALYVIHT